MALDIGQAAVIQRRDPAKRPPNCGTGSGGGGERNSLVKTFATLALAAAFAVVVASPAEAEATTTRNVFSYPVEFTTFVPCLNGGEGESIALTGTAQFVYVSTTDPTGAEHIEELTINQQISGVGLTSGDVYRLAGVHRSGFNARYGGFPGEFDLINAFHLIRLGGGAVLAVHETSHVTVNATGELSAHVENFSIVCEGEQVE
jgi:hypothetical protein